MLRDCVRAVVPPRQDADVAAVVRGWDSQEHPAVPNTALHVANRAAQRNGLHRAVVKFSWKFYCGGLNWRIFLNNGSLLLCATPRRMAMASCACA